MRVVRRRRFRLEEEEKDSSSSSSCRKYPKAAAASWKEMDAGAQQGILLLLLQSSSFTDGGGGGPLQSPSNVWVGRDEDERSFSFLRTSASDIGSSSIEYPPVSVRSIPYCTVKCTVHITHMSKKCQGNSFAREMENRIGGCKSVRGVTTLFIAVQMSANSIWGLQLRKKHFLRTPFSIPHSRKTRKGSFH